MAAQGHPDSERVVLDAQHPWPSLHAFTREEHAHFRGRDAEIEELVGCLRRRILTVLFGLSGLGKTSLLQAGVFPALGRTEFVPVLVRLDPTASEIDLVEQIRKQIRITIQQEGIRIPRGPEPNESLWGFFHCPKLDWFSSLNAPLSAVLVFDQFEEIFTRADQDDSADAGRRHLLRELASLVENRAPAELQEQIEANPALLEQYDFSQQDYRVIISLREDYLPQLEELRKRMPSIMENRFRLTRMKEHQALQAILEPGREVITESVAREVVKFIAGSSLGPKSVANTREVDPALLSLMCSELNNQRLQDNLPLITSELLIGRSDRILDDFYLRSFEFIPEEKRSVARRLVEDRLLTGDKYRETLTVETFRRELEQNGLPGDTLDQLVDKRLLQLDERHGLQRVELAHDVLTKVVGAHRDRRKDLEAIEALERREQEEREAVRRREDARSDEIRQLRKARNRYLILGGFFAVLLGAAGVLAFNLRSALTELERTKAEEAKRKAKEQAAKVFEAELPGKKTETEPARAQQVALQKATELLAKIRSDKLVPANSALDRQISEILGEQSVSLAPAALESKNKSRELDRVGDEARDNKKFEDALKAYSESKALRQNAVTADNGKDPELEFDVSVSHNNIGNLYFDQEKFSEALTEFSAALKIRQKLADKNTDKNTDPRWRRGCFFSLLNISDAQLKLRNLQEARKNARDAYNIATDLGRAQPANPTWKNDQKLAQDQIARIPKEGR